MDPGPNTKRQLLRLKGVWKQGEHVMLSGPTGSGKTEFAAHLDDMRAEAGGHVVVCCMKPIDDEVIIKSYQGKGYVRWDKWKKNPSPFDNKVLLWPDVSKAKGNTKHILAIQKEVFSTAVAKFISQGRRTIHIDEALYWCDPQFMNMSQDLGMMHSIGRSGHLTMVTLMQRPSNVPLIVYGSASHAFIGRTRETTDAKRLATLGAKEGGKKLFDMVGDQAKHDFVWAPIDPDWPAEHVNLKE